MQAAEAVKYVVDNNTSEFEDRIGDEFADAYFHAPLPKNELLDNLGPFMRAPDLVMRRPTWARHLAPADLPETVMSDE